MREGRADTHGGDGVNGTIVVPKAKIAAAGAGPKDKVRVKVEANGHDITMTRKIHSSGNTLTIPYEKRQELGLEPGDTIRFWIESAQSDDRQPTALQETLAEKEEALGPHNQEEDLVAIGGSFTYHLLKSDEEGETVCGAEFEDEDARIFTDPGDALDACPECKAWSSETLSPEEAVDLFEAKIDGFERSSGPIKEFTEPEINALVDAVVELEDSTSELREYRARVARLEQRVQELEQNLNKADAEG